MPFNLIARPEGRNRDYKNEGGLIILIQGDTGEIEVGRVAFERTNSANPDKSFDEMCTQMIETAKATMRHVNELTEKAGELQ